MSVEIANQKNPLLFSNRFIDLKKREKKCNESYKNLQFKGRESKAVSKMCTISSVHYLNFHIRF